MIVGTPEYTQLSQSLPDESPSKSRPSTLAEDHKLLALMMKAETLTETFGPDYPEVRSVGRQIELARRFQNRSSDIPEQSPENDDSDNEGEGTPSLVDAYVQLLEQQLDESKRMDETLSRLYEQEHEAARQLSNFQFEDKRLSADIERAEQFYSSLMTQLQSVDVGKDLGGYTASVIAPAKVGSRISPNMMRTIPSGVFLGFLAGCGLAYLAEISDKSFRSSSEVGQRLNLPVIGHVHYNEVSATVAASHAAGETLLDPSLCVFHTASSPQSEAYRAVRTALYFSTRGQEHSVFQVTSPEAGDGKTTLAANLAISFAQAGERTLLVDADLRKPRLHKLFGIDPEQGLAAVIGGQYDVAEAILESGVAGLQLLPAGKVPANPAELLSQPRFKELIDLVREQYDYVIVDTPPLLAVTDPCAVSPRVDGVLLTVRITKDGRPKAERAKAILAAHEVKVLGVVVNDADSALHSDRYGYGYRYGGGYAEDQDSSYHSEKASPRRKRRRLGARQKV